jgi:hypothetical protein
MSKQFDGRCLCGAVQFVATGDPIGVAWCHCQSCRKHSGAPVSVFVAFSHDAYTVTKGEITKFNSSPGKVARVLRKVRLNLDMRRRILVRNAFPHRRIR